jgi:hypothetical protein
MTLEEARKLELGHKVLGGNGVKGIVTRSSPHSFMIRWEGGDEDLYGFGSLRWASVAGTLRDLEALRREPSPGAEVRPAEGIKGIVGAVATGADQAQHGRTGA